MRQLGDKVVNPDFEVVSAAQKSTPRESGEGFFCLTYTPTLALLLTSQYAGAVSALRCIAHLSGSLGPPRMVPHSFFR